MSVGRGGPDDRGWPRWSSAGIASLLSQTSEGDYIGARENLCLYHAGPSRTLRVHPAQLPARLGIVRLLEPSDGGPEHPKALA